MLKTTKSKIVTLIILGIVVFLLMSFCILISIEIINTRNQNKIEQQKLQYNNMINGIAIVEEIYIYGMHFNIKGKITNTEDIENIELILYNTKEQKSYDLIHEYTDNEITFYTSDKINEGIYLDEIEIGNYYLLLKITKNNKAEYYTLYNKTKYTYMDYYTITKNDKNNYIQINSLLDKITITVEQKQLPKNIYDITIDPGHGGDDTGAVRNDIYEEYINLEVALKLKKELEDLGLKVKITRTGDYNPGYKPGISPYGENGRVAIGYESKSKLFLSIHSNNLPLNPNINGVEIYTSEKNNKQLAMLIADNIVSQVGINYSTKQLGKKEEGVFVRNFTTYEVNQSIKDAIENNYTPYENLTNNTQYYYVIRETGGIITNAYVDGRYTKYDANIFYDSNIGLDGYLIEMGYMTNANDLNFLLNKKSEYAKGIAIAIKKYLNITD